MGRAHSLDKLSSEWDRPNELMVQNIYMEKYTRGWSVHTVKCTLDCTLHTERTIDHTELMHPTKLIFHDQKTGYLLFVDPRFSV